MLSYGNRGAREEVRGARRSRTSNNATGVFYARSEGRQCSFSSGLLFHLCPAAKVEPKRLRARSHSAAPRLLVGPFRPIRPRLVDGLRARAGPSPTPPVARHPQMVFDERQNLMLVCRLRSMERRGARRRGWSGTTAADIEDVYRHMHGRTMEVCPGAPAFWAPPFGALAKGWKRSSYIQLENEGDAPPFSPAKRWQNDKRHSA
jgi:hypothetical protein